MFKLLIPMKLFLSIALVTISSLQLHAQDTTKNKPLITPAGKPFGEIASAKIGKAGGTIKSADGGLEVIIPENALDSKKTISIQSTHNALDDNDRGSYRLEPSGVQFKNPVQLIFHCNGDSEITEFQTVAWQDAQGQWRRPKSVVTDSIQQTVTVLTNHFSRWTRFSLIMLSPNRKTVKVNKTVSLHLVSTDDIKDLLGDDMAREAAEELHPESILASPSPIHPQHYYSDEWTVNGIKNGGPDIGTVTIQDNRNVIYNAPAIPPESNPVAVSVQIYSNDKKRKQLLTSHITVIGDQYHFTFIHIDENGCYFLVDSSSCLLNLNMEKRTVVVTKIKNYTPYSDWPSSCGGCKNNWTNKESLKGLVEITGISYSHIIPPAKPGGLINVNINFIPTMGNTPSAIVSCPGAPTTYTTPSKPYPASPQTINFDIDGDDIIIHAAGKTGINELVIQGKEEKAIIYIYKVHQL